MSSRQQRITRQARKARKPSKKMEKLAPSDEHVLTGIKARLSSAQISSINNTGSEDIQAVAKDMPGWMNHKFAAAVSLNENELTSIAALIAYVAHITKHHEVYVERLFADRFNIPNVKCLPSERYDDAIRYLVDQVPTNPSSLNSR